jgi:hypothetical protein
MCAEAVCNLPHYPKEATLDTGFPTLASHYDACVSAAISKQNPPIMRKMDPNSSTLLSMLRSWIELTQAKVPENNQNHHDYTDNVKYVVSTHLISPAELPFGNTVVDCPEGSMPHVL